MAGPVYSNLVMSLLRVNNKLVEVEPGAYTTSLPVHTLSFRLMGWFSMVCGALLFAEQYFLRRVSCFAAKDFNQPPTAIAEYCWEHGKFTKNTTSLDFLDSLSPPPPLHHSWVLQAYAYFFVRFFIFAIPHIVWNLKYRAQIQALIRGCVDVLKELEAQWIQHGQLVETAYHPLSDEPQQTRAKLHRSMTSIMALTRDTVQITRHQVPHYSGILTFLQLRMFLEVVCLCGFVLIDFVLFLICTKYDSTDFHCDLPNGETIRCMTPMMQLLWQVGLVSLLCSCFTLLMNASYAIYLSCAFLSSNTKDCFLQHIPFSATSTALAFKQRKDTRLYKLLSMYLMHNFVIVQPLNFLESYVAHLEENQQVPMELLVNSEDLAKVPDNHNVKHREKQEAWDNLLSTDI